MIATEHHYKIDLECPKCGFRWKAWITEEFGIQNFDRNDDCFCPECGTEAVE